MRFIENDYVTLYNEELLQIINITDAQAERKLNEKYVYEDPPFDFLPVSTASISGLNLALFNYDYLPKAISEKILAQNEKNIE